MPELSKRLEKIISFVEKGAKIADVGCDHGFVPIELIKRGIASSASAVDVNEDPLSKARENAEKAGLSDRIDFYLSNGLEKLPPDRADTLIIAGMGGILITRILDSAPALVMAGIRKCILAPQSEYEYFRHYLADKGYEIEDEALISEDAKYYPILVLANTRRPYSYKKKIFYRYGKILPERGDITLRENILNDLSVIGKILENPKIPASRRKELEEEKRDILWLIDGYFKNDR